MNRLLFLLVGLVGLVGCLLFLLVGLVGLVGCGTHRIETRICNPIAARELADFQFVVADGGFDDDESYAIAANSTVECFRTIGPDACIVVDKADGCVRIECDGQLWWIPTSAIMKK